jgi:sarcosine oxidase subunit gamma
MPEADTLPSSDTARVSPLAKVAAPGLFGADPVTAGVELSVRHPASIVTVIARKGCAERLADAFEDIKNCDVHWAGFDQYYAVADGRLEGALYRDLKGLLGSIATLSDQSHGRIIIRISGPNARKVLAKGTPVDLHEREFPIGKSAVTQMAHVGVHLTRIGEDAFELSVFRGFAESFWEWLAQQAEEFGYRVT